MNNTEENKTEAARPVKKKRTLLQKIVNAVLYTAVSFLLLLLILFGISQTHTFREFLRETIIEEANSSLNGKIFIGEIDGTIFTSLILRNTIVSMGSDTLLKAEGIGVMTSPLQLLLKKIYIRNFEIKNASINLAADENGELNLSKLFPPSEEPDTAESEFPFLIQVADLRLNNVDLSYKNYGVKKSSFHDSFNFNDLEIKNLNLDLNARLNINDNSYEADFSDISFLPNVNGFNLKELSGKVIINEKNVDVRDLYIKTSKSEAELSVTAINLNIFDTLGIDLSNTELNLKLSSESFSFDDVRIFVPSFTVLKGKIGFDIEASGKVEDLNINQLQVFLENSNIEGSAEIKNLLDENLLISADLSDSYIDQNDIENLLADTEVPIYPELGLIEFNTLTYNGSPLNFKTELEIETEKGGIEGTVSLDMRKEPMSYQVKLNTDEVDIEPFAGIKSSLNIAAEINGRGVSPESFNGTVRLFANGSSINGNTIDTLRLTADAENKNIKYDFRLTTNQTAADINGTFDFTGEEPLYQIAGDVRGLNIAEFIPDTTLRSNLNLSLEADGSSFDQNKINLFLIATLFESSLGDVEIDTTRLVVDLRSIPGEDRVINVISDLADITISGNYQVTQAADLIVSEIDLLSTAFKEKINEIYPAAAGEETENKAGIKAREPLFAEIDTAVNFNFLIDLKDFDLVSAFIGNYNVDIDAEMGGEVESSEDSLLLSFYTDLGYVKVWNEEEAYFITNMRLDTKVSNSFSAASTSDVNLDLNINSKRIFAGSYIDNLSFNFNMNKNIALINVSAMPDQFYAKLISRIDMGSSALDVSIDSLIFNYGNLEIKNKKPLNIVYSQDRIDFKNFILAYNNAELSLDGFLSQTGSQDLNVALNNLRGEDLSINLMGIKPENSVKADINFEANIKGNFSEPLMDAELIIDSISYSNRNFGELASNFNYSNKNLDINIAFLDSSLNENDTALTLKGFVPIDLSFTGAEENYMESKPMNIVLRSDGFNLGAFGDILPMLNKLRGQFTSDLKLTGTPSSLNTTGFIKLEDAAFVAEANNLEYNASLLVNIDGKRLRLDSLYIANAPGTENGGRISGSGSAILDNYNFTSSRFSLSGDLKVLSEGSRSASPSIYGELVIATEGNVEIEFEDNRIFVEAPVLIREANLTFPQTQSSYGSSDNYLYRFPPDSVFISDTSNIDYERLVEISNRTSAKTDSANLKKSIFDYDIDLRIEDEAEITFVLSREFNQNLVAILEGGMRLEKYGEKSKAAGKLELVEGSTLQFLKTLEAEGSIEFISGELSNPTLDITATYSDYYYPKNGPDADQEIPVAVKLKIKGPLKDLSKRLVTEEDNIQVYYGAKSIQDNSPSPQYDASDAAMFILFGRFNDDATQQERDAIASTAVGLAGSVVGGFLNQQFGDAVKSVELRQVGNEKTVISLVGRAGNFRYSIGTSTDVYQDLSRANIKIEYPFTRRFLIRLERKEAINTEATNINEMINEVGLKYQFEF